MAGVREVMDEPRTLAWIMYAIALASQKEPANFAAISEIADGINHAVPTHKELQTSIRWLQANGMAQKHASGYILSNQGLEVMASIRQRHSTASQVWSALTMALTHHSSGTR
jgi:hypothetical protein